MSETRIVRGVITRVQHRPDYEAPCGVLQEVKDKTACDVPPVCCAYRVTVKDSTGHEERFYAFWPRSAGGLFGLVPQGNAATFRLHLRRVFEFPCTMYGCQSSWEYALDGDADVRR